METRNDNQEMQNNNEGSGRTHGSQHQGGGDDAPLENTTNDISGIDQQEGNMNNGVIGGNMGEDIHRLSNDAGSSNPDENR